MDTFLQILQKLGLDSTLFIQLGIFLVVYAFLSRLLFKPYFAAYTERQKRTEGNEEQAERLIAEAADLETVFQKKARSMNSETKAIYDKSRSEALHEHDQMVAEARANAKRIIDETRAGVEEQLKAARKDLAAEAPEVSKVIVNRLAGRELVQ